VIYSGKRRQRQVVRFVDLVVGDALHAPSVAFNVAAPRPRRGSRPIRRADGRLVCERCTIARSPLRRMRGLLGRSDLGSHEGIYLEPAGSIHTFFMRFAIDAVFLDRDGRVLRVAAALPPWRTAAARGARAVLELRAGECARRGIAAGDVLEIGAAA